MNVVRNNIFVKSKEEPVAMSRPEMHTGIILENNIIVSDNTPMYLTGYRREQAGDLQMLYAENNLIYNVSGEVISVEINEKKYTHKEALENFGLDFGSVVADPQFADYENNDFTLKETSPALKIGFKQIDTKDIGAKR